MMLIYKRTKRMFSFMIAFVIILSVFPAVSLAETFLAMVNVSKMNVYASSSMSSKIGTLSKYTVVDVLSYSGGVARIQKGANVGYACISDMARVDEIAVPATITSNTRVYASASTKSKSTQVKKGMSVNLVAVNGSWALLENKGAVAYCPTKYVTEMLNSSSIVNETFSACAKANTTVYKTYSRTSSSIGTIKKGASVTVYAYNDVWARVKVGSKYGFCLKENLTKVSVTPTPTSAPSPTPENTLKPNSPVFYEEYQASVNASALRVYETASKSGKYLGSMKRGTVCTVHAYDDYWAYISLNGRYGYCAKGYLNRISDQEANPTPTPTPTPTPAPTPTPTPAPTHTPEVVEPNLPMDQEAIFSGNYSNEEKIFLFFTNIAGYSEAAACGIMANMKKESGFRPNAISSGGGYHGLCQWSKSRFQTISSYCEKYGFDPYSLEGQLNYMMHELATTAYGKNLSKF
ncbi:MAG: hypothetical protein IIX93_07340 [Clostridia bacterium]|nr:hypothetical protein [Clostridia bacterium]